MKRALALTLEQPERIDAAVPLTYTLRLHNNGPDPAGNIIVSITIRGQLEITAFPDGCDIGPEQWQCLSPALAPGAEETRSFGLALHDRARLEAVAAGQEHDPLLENNLIEQSLLPSWRLWLPLIIEGEQQQ